MKEWYEQSPDGALVSAVSADGNASIFSNKAYMLLWNPSEVEAHWFLPRIPKSFLDAIVSYFRTEPEMEMACNIYWDWERGKYFLYCPLPHEVSNVTRYSILPSETMEPDQVLGYTKVLSVHSHNQMMAFFSGADDENNEMFPGFYMVVGHVSNPEPMFRLRCSIHGSFGEMDVTEIFG